MTDPYDPLLTYEEAGELLGTGPDLPRRLVVTGRLHHTLHEDEVRVPESALIAYLTIADDASSAGRHLSATDDAASAA